MLQFHGWALAGVLHDLAMVETAMQKRIQTEAGAAQILCQQAFINTLIKDVHNAVIACSPYPDMRPATEAAQRAEVVLRLPGRLISLGEAELVIRSVRESMIAELSREKSVSIQRQYGEYIDNEKLFGE